MIVNTIDREAVAKEALIDGLRLSVAFEEKVAEKVASELERLTEELTNERNKHLYKASAIRAVLQDLDSIKANGHANSS